MVAAWNSWRNACILFLIGLAVLGVFFYESDEGRSRRIEAEMRAADARAAAAVAALGHPNAKVSDTQAFYTCRSALKRLSRDPETAVVPDVGWMKGGADWRFLWSVNTRLVRMKNGLGLDVAAPAVCVVDEVFGDIKLLLLDGKEFIGPNTQLPQRLTPAR